jgi:hypothetical protein
MTEQTMSLPMVEPRRAQHRCSPQARTRQRARRAKLSRMILAGYSSNAGLAENLGVSAVKRDRQVLERRWEKELAGNTDRHKARLLAALEEVKQAAWRAWDESRQPSDKLTVEYDETGEGGPGRTKRQRTSRTGDARYLSILLNAIEAERRIRGLDREPEQPTNGMPPIDTSRFTPDELAILCAAVDRVDGLPPLPFEAIPDELNDDELACA